MNNPNLHSEHSHDLISYRILTHWQNHNPKKLEQFQKENRLEAELERTAQQVSDLLYELKVVKKLGDLEAWEIVVSQFFLPEEEESSSTNPNQS